MTNFNSNEKFCGKSLKSLSADEMSLIYGAAVSGIGGLVSYNNDCLG
ncbi:TPA: mersacidin family lantibiotic [Streptococcus pneumoniae]|nr:mersacidin family lantibiotic [Streptococcus pneumoniae]HEW4473838.1 mersacidin family lantibiotic [Streptococcus pneumoniae]